MTCYKTHEKPKSATNETNIFDLYVLKKSLAKKYLMLKRSINLALQTC